MNVETVVSVANRIIVSNPGMKNREVAEAVVQYFADQGREVNTSEASIAWYKSKMNKKALNAPKPAAPRTSQTVIEEINELTGKLEALREEYKELQDEELEAKRELFEKLQAELMAAGMIKQQ